MAKAALEALACDARQGGAPQRHPRERRRARARRHRDGPPAGEGRDGRRRHPHDGRAQPVRPRVHARGGRRRRALRRVRARVATSPASASASTAARSSGGTFGCNAMIRPAGQPLTVVRMGVRAWLSTLAAMPVGEVGAFEVAVAMDDEGGGGRGEGGIGGRDVVDRRRDVHAVLAPGRGVAGALCRRRRVPVLVHGRDVESGDVGVERARR